MCKIRCLFFVCPCGVRLCPHSHPKYREGVPLVISIVTPERLEAKMLVEACCLGVLLVDVNERCFVFLYCHVYQMFAYAFAEMRRRDELHLYFIALYAYEGRVCAAVVRHNQALNACQGLADKRLQVGNVAFGQECVARPDGFFPYAGKAVYDVWGAFILVYFISFHDAC